MHASNPAEALGCIAIIDDDSAVLNSLRFALELEGFDVQTYSSGLEFFAALPAAEPACVIINYQMPGMNGLEIASRLRADAPLVPIIMLTGLADRALNSRASALGINYVLIKPPPDGDLVKTIRLCLARASAME